MMGRPRSIQSSNEPRDALSASESSLQLAVRKFEDVLLAAARGVTRYDLIALLRYRAVHGSVRYLARNQPR